jgi:hypothetical protein
MNTPKPLIRTEEPTPVQLTRMEGVLNLVAERVVNLATRVDGHDHELKGQAADIAALKSETQTLREQAEADKATAVALALALKEADENRRKKAESTWSPWQKALAVLAGFVSLWLIVSPYIPALATK